MLKNYEKLPNGVIKQKKIINKLPDYDKKYVDDRYNTYGEKGMQMAYLRYGYMRGVINNIDIRSILDVGYGNGDFMRVCANSMPVVDGFDISNYTVPKGCKKVDSMFNKEYDVVCFFDSLEHFEDINFIKDLNTKYVYISLPLCHYFSDKWFKNWKHRREDEHLFHFNIYSLHKFMDEQGFNWVTGSYIEDNIRKPVDEFPNILTAIFERENIFALD